MSKLIATLSWLVFFSLPWQTRWIFQSIGLNGQIFEYGQLSLYASSLLLAICLVMLKSKLVKLPAWFWLLPLWPLMSALWSGQPLLAIYYSWLLLIALGFFWLAVSVKKQLILSAVVVSALAQALLAVHQFTNQMVWPNKWLGMAAHYPEVLGQSVTVLDGVRILRAYGALPHPNILAGWLVIGLILLYYWLKSARQLSVVYLMMAGIIFGGLLLTFSRAAALGLAVWVMIELGRQLKGRQESSRLLAFFATLFLILVVASPLLPAWLGRFGPGRPGTISGGGRVVFF